MKTRIAILLLTLFVSFSIQADFMEDITIKEVKNILIEACGKDDPECMDVVKNKYDLCHKSAKKEFEVYINSVWADEKELDAYYAKITACLKYKDGSVIFKS